MPEKPGSRGYIIPPDPQPAGYRCIGLLIPDDDYYLYAMQGAYEELTHWYKWEKDGTNRATLAAQAWSSAYDITMECYWQKDVMIMCGEEKLDELIAMLAEIRDAILAQNNADLVDVITDFAPIFLAGNADLELINGTLEGLELSVDNIATNAPINNILDGCIDCNDYLIIDSDPSPEVDPDEPPYGNNSSEWDDYRCTEFNWMYDEMVINTFVRTEQITQFLGSAAAVSFMIGLLAGSGIGAPLAAILSLLAILAAVVDLDNRAEVHDDIVAAKDAVVCGLFSSMGTASAKAFVDGESWDDGYSENALEWIKTSITNEVLNQVYGGQLTHLEEGYEGSTDCSACDGGSIPEMHWNIDSDWTGTVKLSGVAVEDGDVILASTNYVGESAPHEGLHRVTVEFGSAITLGSFRIACASSSYVPLPGADNDVTYLIGNPTATLTYEFGEIFFSFVLEILSPAGRGAARRLSIRCESEFSVNMEFDPWSP